MKAFLCSAAAFLLLVGVIIGNCVWVSRVTASVEQALQELPPAAEALPAIERLLEDWQARETLLGLSIPANELEDVTDQLILLRAGAELGDAEGFARAKALCLENVARIRCLERFSLIYIL